MLLAAQPAVPESDAPKLVIESGVVTLASGAKLLVKPGCYLSEATCIASGKEAVSLRERVKLLEANLETASSQSTIGAAIAVLVASVLAFGAGVVLGVVIKPASK